MYWLLDRIQQKYVRDTVTRVTKELSLITANPHIDQLFPYVGRKDSNKAQIIVRNLSPENGIVCDPFSGSGIHSYAISSLNRRLLANEWEPYANRISSAPWRLPENQKLVQDFNNLISKIKPELDYLYWTRCSCGTDHVLYSMFFDREPLRFSDVTPHERLGPNGETINYRGKYKCPNCHTKDKFFDEQDLAHLNELEQLPADPIFNYQLIENSRINLSNGFLIYGSLFPHRSKLALSVIWNGIQNLNSNLGVKLFLEDVFLSIIPQAKYKDYRSKSQDLHCPPVMLREVNLLFAFQEQFKLRNEGLRNYSFIQAANDDNINNPIQMKDYRDFLDNIAEGTVDLVFTDPPWTDGTAYFERAQLYHPWLNYDLKLDQERLSKEMVVTNAPSRRQLHNTSRWWSDLDIFFNKSYQILNTGKFLALFFRPIPANQWLANLNRIKLSARKSGFEPLLSIDVGSSDPSMRIQQSSSYVFSKDVVILFLKLDLAIKREYFLDHDLDQYAYQSAITAQEDKRGPFTYTEWRDAMSNILISKNISQVNSPKEEPRIFRLFQRYTDEVSHGMFLPKSQTPFSGQLFGIPAVERLFAYVPLVIEELTQNGRTFTYEEFLLNLAEYVENGTRELISSIQSLNMHRLIEIYAIPVDNGVNFQRRPLPSLPGGISNILVLEPYEFEAFVAHLLEAQGFTSVALIGRSGDKGVDVSGIDPQGRRTVVQCKRYISHNVSAAPVQRLHSFAVTRQAARKILITTSDFSQQALEEAANTGTELINGHELETLVARFLPGFFT